MQIICQGRKTGKTTALIELAAITINTEERLAPN